MKNLLKMKNLLLTVTTIAALTSCSTSSISDIAPITATPNNGLKTNGTGIADYIENPYSTPFAGSVYGSSLDLKEEPSKEVQYTYYIFRLPTGISRENKNFNCDIEGYLQQNSISENNNTSYKTPIFFTIICRKGIFTIKRSDSKNAGFTGNNSNIIGLYSLPIISGYPTYSRLPIISVGFYTNDKIGIYCSGGYNSGRVAFNLKEANSQK